MNLWVVQVHEPWHDELYDKVLGEIKMLEAGKDTEECECVVSK